jgi:(p)ppGpp synthase/HD superfamily hydrolase
MPRLLRAAALWAAEIHKGDDRDGDMPLPYIHHVLETAHLLRWTGGVEDPEVLAAALLHDSVESGGVGLSEVERRFGARTAGIVAELTRREPAREERDGKSPDEIWRMRTDILLGEIAAMSPEAQSIRLADRLSNFREARRCRKGRRWERYVLQTDEILQTLPRSANPALWDELQEELGSCSGILGA